MDDGNIELTLPDLSDLDLDAVDRLENPALRRVARQLLLDAAGQYVPLAGFTSSTR
ncbi:FxSxx-COOH protein [Frankia sp. Mgl5]|uniref:FxSxx-COOH cyclophane-containing RiPP peptide n=1 Tax=Frankia sp. Mgl5 TaxID=2933793 RepID=UPI00200FB2F8|nr:FxSxx-COOH cyclophane-containing RiPP peptide [Frankia sp. Mgl5]MCK9930345.1 FxSxx-COOH protein [Frankia sp. Mgl5]